MAERNFFVVQSVVLLMTSAPANRYRRWFEYKMNAYWKILPSLNIVPAVIRSSSTFQKAVDLFAHTKAARKLWRFRLWSSSQSPHRLFTKGSPFKSLESLFEKPRKTRTVFTDRFNETELARLVKTSSLEGPPFRYCVEDTLTQLFGHSWQYRGQIALPVKSLGGIYAVAGQVFRHREVIPRQEESKL